MLQSSVLGVLFLKPSWVWRGPALAALALLPVTATAAHATTSPQGPSIQVKTFRISSPRDGYRILIQAPNIEWPAHARAVARINARIDRWEQREVRSFVAQSVRFVRADHGLPKSLPPSTLTLTGRVTDFTPEMVSLSFEMTPYFRGEAQPAQVPGGLTFLLTSGRPLTFHILFRPGVGAANRLAKLAAIGLRHFRPAGVRCYVSGVPKGRNIQAWWISPNGLVLAFPAGRYTAAYCGLATVTVSPRAIRPILSPIGSSVLASSLSA